MEADRPAGWRVGKRRKWLFVEFARTTAPIYMGSPRPRSMRQIRADGAYQGLLRRTAAAGTGRAAL